MARLNRRNPQHSLLRDIQRNWSHDIAQRLQSAPAFAGPAGWDYTWPATDVRAPAPAYVFRPPACRRIRRMRLAAHVDCLLARSALLPRGVVLGTAASGDRFLLLSLHVPLSHCLLPWDRRAME